ncbi:MAG TPA: cation-transporting P-type ATPase, partial [Bacillota bacterium]|nr:cation-transporting P-type ATPase [Bacillota bacterium]
MALRNEKTSLPWHSQTAAEITAKLGVYPGTGLSARAAKDRLRRIGPNDVPHSGVASVFRKAVYSTLDLPLIFLLLT